MQNLLDQLIRWGLNHLVRQLDQLGLVVLEYLEYPEHPVGLLVRHYLEYLAHLWGQLHQLCQLGQLRLCYLLGLYFLVRL